MNEEEYDRIITNYFNRLMDRLLRRDLAGVCVVIIENDNTCKSDSFGIPGIVMVGALEYAKSEILKLNSPILEAPKVEP